jgi:predicted ferric reductase
VLVDGPYGKALNTRYWDNFLFVATDIGISAQMPYLKELIDLQRHPRRLSRVSIIWVVEDDRRLLFIPK